MANVLCVLESLEDVVPEYDFLLSLGVYERIYMVYLVGRCWRDSVGRDAFVNRTKGLYFILRRGSH